MALLKKAYTDVKTFRKVFFSLLVVCLLTGASCVQFYQQVQVTVQDESEHYLREISRRTTSNVKRVIDDNFSALETLRSIVENNTAKNFVEIRSFLKQQVDYWDFTNILLIEETGVAYDLDGNKVSITGDSFLRTLSLVENIIAPTQVINNEEKTVFSSPLNNVLVEGRNLVAIATIFNPEQFDKILSMDSFDDQAFSYIVDNKGKVVVGNLENKGKSFGYNVLHTLIEQDASALEKVDSLQSSLDKKELGQFTFNIFGSKEYLVYAPVEMNDWYLFTFVPATVVNTNSDLLLQSTVVMIIIVFFVFLLFLIFITYSYKRNKQRLEHMVYVDELTNGHTVQWFLQLAQTTLNEKEKQEKYAFIFTNVQHFKLLNDQFGRLICDRILQSIHRGIEITLQEKEYIAHYAADNFVVLVKYQTLQDIESRFATWLKEGIEEGKQKLEVLPILTMEYGIYIIEDYAIEINDMIDCSKLALRNGTKAHGQDDHIRYTYYNEAVRNQLYLEKHIEDMMEDALENNEFKVYLQPKYKTGTQLLVGAEALVRWQSEQDGMIYPNDFIPLFEKNGFIVKLDLWMFDQVCQVLQSWKAQGKQLIQISVNCSRVHLNNPMFLQSYKSVFEKYDFEAKYLELEFTENMVFEDTELLTKVIKGIHEIGFECSMDDFGSGYSSLNLLQEIHVDTLKLDRIFFKQTFENSKRSKAIIACVLDMAQSLCMTTVAEGVEEWQQVEVLEELGCDYIQGYVYAKPMLLKEFQELYFSKLNQQEVINKDDKKQ